MKDDQSDRTAAIARLNDRLRSEGIGGQVMMTAGVAALEQSIQLQVVEAVRRFGTFTADNDPYGEHDFGAVDISDERFFWKIDAYDPSLMRASPDPTDPAVTRRVLTIMRADEY